MSASAFRLAALLILFGLGLTACGVNGSPDPPTPDKFPHQYPPPEAPATGTAATTTAPPPPAQPAPAPGFPPNTTNTNQPMYQ